MLRHNKIFQVLGHLLVVAISFMQISVASALMMESDDSTVSLAVDQSDVSSINSDDCFHVEAHIEKADCCLSNECAERNCAEKSCVTGANSVSSAVFLSQTRIPQRLFSKSRVVILNYLHAGISPAALYKPPR